MKLLVDGVFFQLYSSGIARVWASILPYLASYPDLDIVLLDRGMSPSIDGIRRVEFPSYTFSNTAADSLLIEEYCRELGIDIFTSTYYTTPTTLPSVLVVYDMIPEVLGFDLSGRAWQEKQIAISFASYYLCISENTRTDLMHVYPSITDERLVVKHCGVDHRVFRPLDLAQIEDFKQRLAISHPYYLTVGSRGGYKNADLLFRAAQSVRDCKIDILCVGGEPEINPTTLAGLPGNVCARRVELTDQDLACAYSGAEALIYPSLYEGFGMPVVEAMACGCPVVATRLGSLGEVAGDAAVFVSGHDPDELRSAMAMIRGANERAKLIERGLQQAAPYSWELLARGFYNLVERAYKQRHSLAMRDFFMRWKRLRAIQAEVDVGF